MILRDPEEVFNQPPPLENYNLFEHDTPLREALHREGAGWVEARLLEYGVLLGKAETLKLGELANRNAPILRTHDRFGYRIDEVDFHPAWHELMRLGISHGAHSLPWTSNQSGSHAARAALNMLRHQLDEGTSCPISMSYAAIPCLRLQPQLAAEWEPRIVSTVYDSRFIPANQKRGALLGMAMTERQGGSDVRANTTRAQPLERGIYEITGHKWFCSAPMCDAFLILAQAPKGLSCFLLPRWKPDGTRNAFHLVRLKDKLGNRSNASSEVEFHGAWAQLVGEEGRGVSSIIEMVRHTRLDCAWGAASTLRRAVAEAAHHANYCCAFGKRLIEQPLMKNVLTDLCVESEAATALVMRLARGFDEAARDEAQMKFTRLVTAVAKYWITKRAMIAVGEAMECLGGNGYVEESVLSRLYRDAPVNSIWEGCGNVQCLDALRAVDHDRETLEVVLREIRAARGASRQFDAYVDRLERELTGTTDVELRARRIVERLALALQGALLIQHAPSNVAEAFCVSRLAGEHGLAFGTLPAGTDLNGIMARAFPKI
jgi:putative acyl-CoA dehydrogenase